jgi:hypothetical protein
VENIKFVQRVKKPDGKVHLYFRKGKHREGPLINPDGSDALRQEVEAILKRLTEKPKVEATKNTVCALLEQYNRSSEFLSKARSTQVEYQRIIDELIRQCQDVLLQDVSSAWLRDAKDIWALRGHKAANDRRQVLKNALMPAIIDERIPSDPFAKVGKMDRPHDAGESHPIWEDAEVTAAIELALQRGRPGLARAIALGRWGGFRRGTICSLPVSARTVAIDRNGNSERRIYWITEKRKVLADKREDPRLSRLLAETSNKSTIIAYNADGQPWKPRQLNQAIERLVEALVKVGKARPVLTIHGLRHARGVELALAGASDAEIMSQLEHATDRAAKIYRRQADRRKLADSAQDRIDAVIDLQEKRKKSGPNVA